MPHSFNDLAVDYCGQVDILGWVTSGLCVCVCGGGQVCWQMMASERGVCGRAGDHLLKRAGSERAVAMAIIV